ncbi:MAG: hypothetical protein AAFY20_09295 [Cyanobacteria bacterium J06639_14]
MTLISDPDLLLQSSQGRAGTPDGNIFIDIANKQIQLINSGELASFDYGADDGSDKPIGVQANALDPSDGVLANALFSFLVEERGTDNTLRSELVIMRSIDRKSGQYEFVNGWTLATDGDRSRIRSGGFVERDAAGVINRIYYCPVGIGSALNTDQGYYALTSNFATDGTDFVFPGLPNEVVRVDTSDQTFFEVSIRPWQREYTRSNLIQIGNTEGTDAFIDNHSLRTSVDTNVTATENDVSTNALYTGITLNYLPGIGFAPWQNSVTYAANAVVSDSGRWYITTAGGTSNGTGVGDDSGVTWTAYAGEREIGGTWYPFNIIFANGGNDATYSTFYQRERWLLRQSTNINDNSANTGTIVGRRASELLGYTLGTPANKAFGSALGVFVDDLDSTNLNSLAVRDATGTLRTFPQTVPLVIPINDIARSDPDLKVSVYFDDANGATFPGSSAIIVDDASGTDIVLQPFTGTVDDTGWTAGSVYAINTVVQDVVGNEGVWYLTAAGGTSAGPNLAGDTGVNDWVVYQANASYSYTFDRDGNNQNGRTPGTDAAVTAVATGRTKAEENNFSTTIDETGGTLSVVMNVQRNYRNQST